MGFLVSRFVPSLSFLKEFKNPEELVKYSGNYICPLFWKGGKNNSWEHVILNGNIQHLEKSVFHIAAIFQAAASNRNVTWSSGVY